MTCANCDDKGLTVLNWTDAEPDYAVCLCSVGQELRRSTNEGKTTVALWRLWCAVHQVDPSRVRLLEDVHSVEELVQLGFGSQPSGNRESALLAMAKKGKR
jgi:hypothetical protein